MSNFIINELQTNNRGKSLQKFTDGSNSFILTISFPKSYALGMWILGKSQSLSNSFDPTPTKFIPKMEFLHGCFIILIFFPCFLDNFTLIKTIFHAFFLIVFYEVNHRGIILIAFLFAFLSSTIWLFFGCHISVI